MSKDKGNKKQKKERADQSSGKKKAQSAYKSEGDGGKEQHTLDVFTPKTDGKAGGGHKKGQ